MVRLRLGRPRLGRRRPHRSPFAISKLVGPYAYVAAVAVAGLAVFAVAVGMWSGRPHAALPAVFWLFTAFIVVGELYPIKVPRGDSEGHVTTSTTFAFALMLTAGTVPAMLGLVAAGVIADLIHRRTWWKIAFNAGQYALTMFTAGALYKALTARPLLGDPVPFASGELPAILLAGLVFFAVNIALLGTAVVILHGYPLKAVSDNLVFQAVSGSVLLTLAPLVVAAAERSLALLPLLALQMAVVYKSVAVYFEKEHQALHDDLTGLPNRALFRDRVQQAILVAPRAEEQIALMIIDLDRFKDVNDTLGHHTGDLLLREVGARLTRVLRHSDTVARLGGDEFGVVLWSVPGPEAANRVADKIRAALVEPFRVADLTLDIEGSIGIALHPQHGSDPDTLIRHADVAMYVAKRNHRGRQIYSAELDEYSPARLAQAANLRRALEEGHLTLHYQPKRALATGEVRDVEALVRWQDPELGMVPPDEFIPIAEYTGLIGPLTMQVLERALRQCRAWHAEGLQIGVAVNISPRNLHDTRLADQVGELLAHVGLDRRWLQLEITENTIMADPVRAMETLTRLHAMGVGLAIDDFGVGNSSLAYLKRLPVDELKIDRSFVMNMCTDEDDAVIVRSTIELGRNLGLRVVAEGVESEAAWNELAALGCDMAQGYYLSRPLPPGELLHWLRSGDARTRVHDPARQV